MGGHGSKNPNIIFCEEIGSFWAILRISMMFVWKEHWTLIKEQTLVRGQLKQLKKKYE